MDLGGLVGRKRVLDFDEGRTGGIAEGPKLLSFVEDFPTSEDVYEKGYEDTLGIIRTAKEPRWKDMCLPAPGWRIQQDDSEGHPFNIDPAP